MQTKVERETVRISQRKISKTNVLTKVAVLSSIAYIMMLIEFPVPFAPGFLKMDFSDIPALVASFAISPIAGVMVELLKNIIKLVTNTKTGGVGELGNFLVGASFVFTAGYFYKIKRERKYAVIGCLVATIVMTITAAAFNNFILIPFYAQIMPIEAIVSMGSVITDRIHDVPFLVLYGITPFNIFKGLVISLITILIYKKIRPLIK